MIKGMGNINSICLCVRNNFLVHKYRYLPTKYFPKKHFLPFFIFRVPSFIVFLELKDPLQADKCPTINNLSASVTPDEFIKIIYKIMKRILLLSLFFVLVLPLSAQNGTMADLYKNVKYNVKNLGTTGSFEAGETGQGIFFQDAFKTVTFAAYSPYQSSIDAATLCGIEGTVTGVNTQVQTTQATQETFDYLFTSGATASKSTPTVEFKDSYQFKHKMPRLILVLQTSMTEGFTANQVENSTYTLGELIHNGTFNVTSGEAKAATETAVSDWNIIGNYHVDGSPTDAHTYTMILYPQTLGSTLTFSASIEGKTYTNNSNIHLASLDADTSYTITMKKTGLKVSGCTIGKWNSGGSGSGDATM